MDTHNHEGVNKTIGLSLLVSTFLVSACIFLGLILSDILNISLDISNSNAHTLLMVGFAIGIISISLGLFLKQVEGSLAIRRLSFIVLFFYLFTFFLMYGYN